MSWVNERSLDIGGPPEAVWRLFERPQDWALWDPAVTSATREGPFELGSRIRIEQRRAPTRTLRIVAVEPGRSYSSEDRMPFVRLRFDHEVEPRDGGCRVTLRQTISGPLAPLFSLLFGRRIARGAEPQIEGIRKVVEAGSGA